MKTTRTIRGQALVMVTTSLILLCGMMGLAVDLGWGYFVKKEAQRAADAAALAGVEKALADVGAASSFKCGVSGLTCPVTGQKCPASPPTTPPISQPDVACLYAKQNGFSTGTANQNVVIDADANADPGTKPIPTAPGIKADYWITARVSQKIPQLFSAVMGFPWSQSSARATAAIIDSPVNGSIYLLNRENDPNAVGDNRGTDLDMQGGGGITATGGMYLASAGNCSGPTCAAHMGGSTSVTAAYVGLRSTGNFDNSTNVTPTPTSGMPEQANFQDPMKGKGQPPPPTAAQAPAPTTPCSGTLCGGPIAGDIIDGTSSCVNVGPGTYYGASVDKKGKITGPSGNPITIQGCVNFVNSSGGSSGFSNYVFFGGLNANNPGSVITMSPGRYVLAGTNQSGPGGNPLYSQSNGVTVQDQTPLVAGNMVANTDAGEIMVFTDSNYPGLYIPSALSSLVSSNKFQYGGVDVQMGTTSASQFNLHGLNVNSTDLPSELAGFAPTVLWQDQQNSKIKYDANGNIVDDVSCGGGGTLATPCINGNPEVTTTASGSGIPTTLWELQAAPGLHLYGVVYQPRGSTLDMQGTGGVTTPMVIITGTLRMGGSPTVLQPLTNSPLLTRMAALVE
jgi:hypothetical protein